MDRTCCFIGHRKIINANELSETIKNAIENLITIDNVDTFLFGSKSDFNNLCYEIISQLKNIYPHIKRIYVRAEYPYINEDYMSYLLKLYEHTYYPDNIINSGKSCYVERNIEMIKRSKFCIMYYDTNYTPTSKKAQNSKSTTSGTKIAYNYAINKKRTIINVFI